MQVALRFFNQIYVLLNCITTTHNSKDVYLIKKQHPRYQKDYSLKLNVCQYNVVPYS
ncbi:hypothetical protein Hanom_Chr14g01318031 [Helianthus anomalus]